MRIRKIKQRKQKIKDVRRFYDGKYENGYIHGRKIQSAVFGEKEGLLSKGYYGAICSGVKTKTKNACASYRHKGGYGKAVKYSGHDKRQIARMEIAEAMWNRETIQRDKKSH